MFTQIFGFNTNKCPGCPEHCVLGATEHKKKKNRFIPTIKDQPRGYYYDKKNIRHNIRPYTDKSNAIDSARFIASLCPKYKIQHSTVSHTKANQCTGCTIKCEMGVTETEQGFMPTVKHKIISTFINAYGITIPVVPRPKQSSAQELAERIVKRCDFYKKTLTRTTPQTK